jgi:pimeloyl-ACP methyl ester carboxylesterase/putative sterol carrier protein
MSGFPEQSWWPRFAAALNEDPEFGEAARWLDARVEFRSPDAAWALDLRGGGAVVVTEGPHPLGADVTMAAPEDEWGRLLSGEIEWFQANSPGLGKLELGGDVVTAMRNVLAMSRLLAMMSRVDGEPRAPEPSPDPRPSGAETSGHYIDVDGLRVYYEEAGEGPALVCFHAACQDTLMWRHTLDGLSDEFRVIAIDAPSHAKTLEPADGPFRSLSRHAEFNERFLELMGLERPAIAGCSMGGNLVLEMASRRPDGYAAVASCEGADYTPTVSQFLLDMLLINGQGILDGWSRSLTGNRTPPDRAREVVWQIKRVNPEVMAGDLTGYAGFDKREEMGRVASPVLLLRGDADWLVSQEQVEETAARISDARISVLAGTGHYPMIENPFEFNEAVRGFLHEAGVG